jgi:hypothetical protein
MSETAQAKVMKQCGTTVRAWYVTSKAIEGALDELLRQSQHTTPQLDMVHAEFNHAVQIVQGQTHIAQSDRDRITVALRTIGRRSDIPFMAKSAYNLWEAALATGLEQNCSCLAGMAAKTKGAGNE